MNRFSYSTPSTFAEASALLADKRFSLPVLKAGGLDVLDHMKEGLMEPDLLINIKRLRVGRDPVQLGEQGEREAKITIEATATLTELATSPVMLKHAPVIAQAAGSAATPQVRNVATAAGNLLQRPRCWYYRQEQFDCLKKGGATCYAVEGENKFHAIFGDGPCHIVHASNLALAVAVCEGEVELSEGGKTLKMGELFHMPETGVRSEHGLKKGDVVTGVRILSRPTSAFYAIKEKQSFDWPLVMAGVALWLNGDKIFRATVVAGAVAPVPWALPKVDEALKGVSVNDEAALKKAIACCVDRAKPMTQNGYKLKLLPVAIRRAVLKAAGKLKEDHA